MQRIIESRHIVYFTAAFVSILLSYWVTSQTVLLNPDAICYLQSAKMGDEGLSAVMSLCSQSQWPFYSLLIASFVKMTAFSYEHAAFILNGLFSLLTVLIFIRIVAFFTEKRKILWLAAFVILFAHDFNVLRQDVIRDHGFWFFYLLSIFCLLQYFKKKQAWYAFGFSGSLLLATLFRIEGAIFLLLMPFLAWLETRQSLVSRLKSFLTLNISLLVAAAVLLGMVILHPAISLGRLSDLYNHFQLSNFYSKVVQHYIVLADGMGHAILGRSEHDKYLIYFFTLVVWYSWVLISALSLIYAVMFVYALTKKCLPFDKAIYIIVLFAYIAINVAITFIFLVENQFLSKRYILALTLTCMLWIPFALDHLMMRWRFRYGLSMWVMVFIVVYGLGGMLYFGPTKQYIRNAGDWLSDHASKTALIYSNDYQVMYYSHHFGNEIFAKQREFADLNTLQNGNWKKYDYLAIRLNKKTLAEQQTLLNEIKEKPIIVFNGHNEDQVRIYRRNQP